MDLRLCDTQPLWLTPTFQHHCIGAQCLCHTEPLIWEQLSSADADQTTVSWSRSTGAIPPYHVLQPSSPPLPHRAINLWHLSDTEQESLSPFVPPCSLRLSCVLNFLPCKSSQTNMWPASGAGEDVSSSYYSSNVWSLNLSNPPTLSFYLLLHPLFLSRLLLPGFENHYSCRCCVLGAGPSCLLSPERNYAVWLIFCFTTSR